MPEGGNEAGGSGVVINLNNPGPAQTNSNQQVNNSGDPQNQNSGDFLTAFTNEDNRKYAEQKGWKDTDTLLKSYRDLEKAYSQKTGQTNNQQQTNGNGGEQPVIPNSPADYQFQLDQNFPQNGFYDKNLAEMFKGWSHQAKLSTAQAQALHNAFATHMATSVANGDKQSQQQYADRVNNTFTELTKAWGEPKTPGFERSLEMGRRAIANLEPGLKDALVQHGVIGKDAKGQEVVLNAAIFKALSKAGSQMFAEDNVFGAPATSENPFDPKTRNAEKAGKLIRSNPEMARSLIQAAGPEAQADWAWWLAKKN